MKKKLFLAFALVMLFACFMALGINAEELKVSSTNAYGEVNVIEGFDYSTKLSLDQRMVLDNGDGTFSTFPSAYALNYNLDKSKRGERFQFFDLSVLSAATGKNYTHTSVIRYEFPEGITIIHHDDRANINFNKCVNMVEVVFPSTLKTFTKSDLLNGVTALVKVDMSKSTLVTSMPGSTMANCTSLTDVTLAPNLTSIAANTFYACASLTHVAIPSSVTSFGDKVFYNCKLLQTIELAEGVTKIGSQTFYNCNVLENVTLPSTLKEIGGGAFTNCKLITDIVFPEGLTTIGSGAFNGCTSITSIHIPASVKSIGSDCWRSCSGVTSITFDPDCAITHLYAHTFDGTKATSIVLPNTLQHIGQNCFNISTLVSLNLGDSFIDFNASNASQPPIGSSSSLKYWYLSSTFTADALRNGVLNWSDTPSNKNELKERYVALTIFYTGTKEAAEAILLKAATGGTDGAPLNEYFASMILISAEEYALAVANGTLEEGAKNNPKRYFVYGYNRCDAFYNGVHSEGVQINDCLFGCGRNCGKSELLENPKHSLNKTFTFGENGYFSAVCVKETCANCNTVTIDETVNAIFEWKGYSKSTFGESYSVVQGFYIDREALAQYKVYAPDFDFGIMATGNAKGEAIKPQIGDEKVFTAIFDNTVNDYYDVKVTGITQALMDKNIVFCIYVLDSGKMYYLDGEKTADTVVGISYNNIA